MATRTFKLFSINTTSAVQPLVGTFITANTSPATPDPQGENLTTLPVGDSSMIKQGDYVLIQSVTYTLVERVRVQSVPNGTSIQVRSLQNARTGGVFGTGDWVSLSIPINSVYVQTKLVNTAAIVIGTVGLVAATLANAITELVQVASGQPNAWNDQRNYTANPMDSGDYWVTGTAADGYLPSFGVA